MCLSGIKLYINFKHDNLTHGLILALRNFYVYIAFSRKCLIFYAIPGTINLKNVGR